MYNYIFWDITFLRFINSSDFLTFIALCLAYEVYKQNYNDKKSSFISNLQAIKSELNTHKFWIDAQYFDNSCAKNWYSPSKIIYKLNFLSTLNIINKDFNELLNEYSILEDLTDFNERVTAFNDLLDYQKSIITANPVASRELLEELDNIGVYKKTISLIKFISIIENPPKGKVDIYRLAEEIKRINSIVHIELIGNKNKKDSLSYMYSKISDKVDIIIKELDSITPWYFRSEVYLLAFLVFVFIEIVF